MHNSLYPIPFRHFYFVKLRRLSETASLPARAPSAGLTPSALRAPPTHTQFEGTAEAAPGALGMGRRYNA